MSIFRLAVSELKKLTRSRFAVLVFLLLPALVIFASVLLFSGFAGTNIKIGVLNLDKDTMSQLTVGVVMSMFKGGTVLYVDQDYVHKLLRGEVNAVVIIPENFSKNLYSAKQTTMHFVPSPVDFQLSVVTYQVFSSMLRDLNGSPFFAPQVIRYLFTSPGYPSPQLVVGTSERLFTLPSVLAPIALFLTSAFVVMILSVQTVVQDERRNLIEYYISLNVSSWKYTTAKILSYSFLGTVESIIALMILVLIKVYIPIHLALILLVLNSILHAGLGVLFSAMCKAENLANLAGVSIIIVTFFLSGTVVPVSSMSKSLKAIATHSPIFLENYILRKSQMHGFIDRKDFLVIVLEVLLISCLSFFAVRRIFSKRR